MDSKLAQHLLETGDSSSDNLFVLKNMNLREIYDKLHGLMDGMPTSGWIDGFDEKASGISLKIHYQIPNTCEPCHGLLFREAGSDLLFKTENYNGLESIDECKELCDTSKLCYKMFKLKKRLESSPNIPSP